MKVAFGRMEHGFCLKFDNGVKLSTMFGQHHFCDNHNSFMESEYFDAKIPLFCDNVEVLVFNDKKRALTGWQEDIFGDDDPQDDVRGYVNLTQWLQLVDWCKNWKEKTLRARLVESRNRLPSIVLEEHDSYVALG